VGDDTTTIGRLKPDSAAKKLRKWVEEKMVHTSVNPAQLLAELGEVLGTVPPLATRRHDLPENHAWLGRATNVIERWDPAKVQVLAEHLKQFHHPMAREANEAFQQIMVLLQQAQHDLQIRAKASKLEGYLRQLKAQDELIRESPNREIPMPVSTALARLFREINQTSPEINLFFEGHGRAEVLRSQLAVAIQKISGYMNATDSNPAAPSDSAVKPQNPELVFVIHGRQLLEDFHTFLRALGLKPLEWSEARRRTGKPNPYTWEIVDRALTEAGAIVALLTPDDDARLRRPLWSAHENPLETEYLSQPRQNVLFEAGVAYGRAPQRTVLIRVGSHRPMSDLAGHHILQLDDSPQSRHAVADALRAAGCPVDVSDADWFRAGRFTLTEPPEPDRGENQRVRALDSSTMPARMLFEEADYLHRVYRGLDQDHHDRVRLPLNTKSWPNFGKEWDYVNVSLYTHAERVHWLLRIAQSVWVEMKWRIESVELFQLSESTMMVDLLHSLEEFRQLLRTKFS
jgi:predicted nucleotide-binding protein